MYIPQWVLKRMNGLDFFKVGPTHPYMSMMQRSCIVAFLGI